MTRYDAGSWRATADPRQAPELDRVSLGVATVPCVRKVLLLLAVCGLFVVASCGGRDGIAADSDVDSTTTSDPCPPDELMSDSGCVPIDPVTTTTRATTTTAPLEEFFFGLEYARLPPELQSNFPGLASSTIAQKICDNDAELVSVGMIGVEHYPDLARAGYEWKCPERVKPHDDAVLRAIADAARLQETVPTYSGPSYSGPSCSGDASDYSRGGCHDAMQYVCSQNYGRCVYSKDIDEWIPYPG